MLNKLTKLTPIQYTTLDHLIKGRSFGVLFVIIVAIAKDIYDEVKYKGFDIVDIIATILIPMMLFIKEVKDK